MQYFTIAQKIFRFSTFSLLAFVIWIFARARMQSPSVSFSWELTVHCSLFWCTHTVYAEKQTNRKYNASTTNFSSNHKRGQVSGLIASFFLSSSECLTVWFTPNNPYTGHCTVLVLFIKSYENERPKIVEIVDNSPVRRNLTRVVSTLLGTIFWNVEKKLIKGHL